MARKSVIQRECYQFVQVGEHKVPLRPYYKWRFEELLPFEQLFDKYKDHHRLEVFAKKGLKCVHPECHRVATHLIVTIDQSGHRHVDVVDAQFKLMNVDHIHPRNPKEGSKGEDILENKQPMCEFHNSRKGNKLVPY